MSKRIKVRKTSEDCCHSLKESESSHAHPDHAQVLGRLKRVKGQIEGIERMITDRRYCLDILTQFRAAQSALQAIEGVILEAHLKGCVKEALSSKDPKDSEKKIQELMKLFKH